MNYTIKLITVVDNVAIRVDPTDNSKCHSLCEHLVCSNMCKLRWGWETLEDMKRTKACLAGEELSGKKLTVVEDDRESEEPSANG